MMTRPEPYRRRRRDVTALGALAQATQGGAGVRAGVAQRAGNRGMQHLLRVAARAPQPGAHLGAPPGADTRASSSALPTSVSRALADEGAALPAAIRSPAEEFFGTDLSRLRVHSGAGAASASRDLEAHAFSVGHNIVLGHAGGLTDRRLMAHEIAHALQAPAPAGAPAVGIPGSAAEREADAVASRFASATPRQGGAPVRVSARRSAMLHADARHATATVFDADYLLYSMSGTDYDGATQHFYLSPWDRSHLRRLHGLYLEEGRGISLLTPPEVRRAAGGRGVFITLSATDLIGLHASGRAGAAQFAIDLAQRRLDVTVASVTLSSGANQDFTVSTLPAAVGAALASPLQGVDPADATGVESARSDAASATQERTLSLAGARSEELPTQDISWSDRMDVNTLFSDTDPGRAKWYAKRLAAWQAQLLESAQAHHLPMQLLAAVVLNELADINAVDVLQSGPSTLRGSLGIAQIQIDTARKDRLVDLPPGSHRTGWARSGMHAHDVDDPVMVESGQKLRTGQLLQVPQVAIEAAAREIEMLISRMAANPAKPWQVNHSFAASGPIGDAIYAQMGAGSAMSREGRLADAVCGAYNSPDVITASNISTFTNATIHGGNANQLAQDLFRFRLYRAT